MGYALIVIICTFFTVSIILMADICSIVLKYHYRLIRIFDLDEADVEQGLSFPWPSTWSQVELNDGSWEICIPIIHIAYFQNCVREFTNATIDLNYNPLLVPENDVAYFRSFDTAHKMHGFWLEARLARIHGFPKSIYTALNLYQKLIATILLAIYTTS